MSDTTYTKIDADGFLALSPVQGFYGYLLLDDSDNRLLLDEGHGGKLSVVSFNKVPK